MYSLKTLKVVIVKTEKGEKSEDGKDGKDVKKEKILRGYAMKASVEKFGGVAGSCCNLTMYNLDPDYMGELTNLSFLPQMQSNTKVMIYASENSGTDYDLVFEGDVVAGGAVADYSSFPDVAMNITAITGYKLKSEPKEAQSVEKTDVKSVLYAALRETGLKVIISKAVESIKIGYSYLTGSPGKQISDLAKEYGFDIFFDDDKIIACKPYELVDYGSIPSIDIYNGLIGYPVFSQTGVNFECEYNPSLKFGGGVKLETDIPQANGTWKIIGLEHHLSSEIPGGDWKTSVTTTVIKSGN